MKDKTKPKSIIQPPETMPDFTVPDWHVKLVKDELQNLAEENT